MTVLFHAVNGSGLGHLMRATAIIEQLRALAPAQHIVLMTSAQSRRHLEAVQALDVTLLQVPPDEREPSVLLNRRQRTLPAAVHHRMVSSMVRTLSPRVTVFDTHAPLEVVKAAHATGSQVVFVLRPLRADHLQRWCRTHAAWVHQVLVPSERSEMEAEVGDDAVSAMTHAVSTSFVGGVVRTASLDAAQLQRVSDRYRLSQADRLMVFSSGGGGYAAAQAAFRDRALRLLEHFPTWRGVMVSGPYGKQEATAAGQLEVVAQEDELITLYARADLVVAHAGNNTVEEILLSGARAVLVPMQRRAESQEARAQRLHATGRVGLVTLADDDAAWHQQALAQLSLTAPVREQRRGAANAARNLLLLCSSAASHVVHVRQTDDVEVWMLDIPHACIVAVADVDAARFVPWVTAVASHRHASRIATVVVSVDGQVSPTLAVALLQARDLHAPFLIDVTDPKNPIFDVIGRSR
jgi:predicted glycosyltransferase